MSLNHVRRNEMSLTVQKIKPGVIYLFEITKEITEGKMGQYGAQWYLYAKALQSIPDVEVYDSDVKGKREVTILGGQEFGISTYTESLISKLKGVPQGSTVTIKRDHGERAPIEVDVGSSAESLDDKVEAVQSVPDDRPAVASPKTSREQQTQRSITMSYVAQIVAARDITTEEAGKWFEWMNGTITGSFDDGEVPF